MLIESLQFANILSRSLFFERLCFPLLSGNSNSLAPTNEKPPYLPLISLESASRDNTYLF